jgi:hypothetical protein
MIEPAMTRRFTDLPVFLACLLLAGAAAAGSFPMSPSEAERRLGTQPFEIVEAKRTASGVAGAQKWKIEFRDGQVMKVKWKAAPTYSGDGWNNSPRREIAPYEIQKWFLDEKDYIVPTSEVRCIPMGVYHAKIDAAAKPTIRGTNCVFGVLSMWLQDVEEPPEIWHPEMFDQKNYYSYSISAVDVLTLLIGHKDGRPANVLWSTDGRHQVFSIDNGISFDAFPFNFLVRNWNDIRVPALPRKIVQKLDRIGPEQIETLAILRHLEPDENGVLQVTKPKRNMGPDEGNRVGGGALQIGLRTSELREIEDRIGVLLHKTDSGEIPLF